MRASRRHMQVKYPLRTSMALLSAGAAMLTASCDEEDSVYAACQLTASIGFQGREYTAADEVGGRSERHIEVGRRLGVGKTAACRGWDADRVVVFKVVGEPVSRAVYAEPDGLLVRSHLDDL